MKDPVVTRGSTNVFADLGLENADELLAKSELAAQITRTIRHLGLTQAQAAALMGVTQPKVSDLLKGKLDGFSTDRLFRLLVNLGWDIQISLTQSQTKPRGSVHVTCPAVF